MSLDLSITQTQCELNLREGCENERLFRSKPSLVVVSKSKTCFFREMSDSARAREIQVTRRGQV